MGSGTFHLPERSPMSGEGGVVTNVGEPARVGRDAMPEPLALVIAAARRRLGWLGVRAELARHAALVCAAAAVGAGARPFLWPLAHPVDPWRVALRAVVLGMASAGIALAIVAGRAWRRRPSLLASARRLDDARGLAEVIASGFAFERDQRDDEMARFAVDRARAAVRGLDVERVLVPSPQARSRREIRWLLGAGGAVILGLAVGGIDRVVIERVLNPVTSREAAAAAALRKAAEEAAANAANAARAASEEKKMLAPQPPAAEELVEAARRASEAAQRGDRRSALEALESMRKATRALEADERDQARSLRSLRDELEGASAAAKGKAAADASGKEGAGRPSRASATASEALAKLKRDLDSAGGDKESLRKMIERLERAEAAARAAAERSAGKDASGRKDTSGKGKEGEGAREAAWSRAAAALAEAREAAARGDKEAASRAMERAEREISALEKASRDAASASRMARVADGASELDRAMHAALNGDRSGGGRDGNGEGRDGRDGDSGKDGAGASRTASKDNGDPSGAPGAGPGAGDRAPGPEQRRVTVGGDLQARADVREGERAVSAIEGMGRGGDPRAFREIFPSYDTVVEDGLREDSVPAARRPTVRRYFSSIRPGGDEETRNRP